MLTKYDMIFAVGGYSELLRELHRRETYITTKSVFRNIVNDTMHKVYVWRRRKEAVYYSYWATMFGEEFYVLDCPDEKVMFVIRPGTMSNQVILNFEVYIQDAINEQIFRAYPQIQTWHDYCQLEESAKIYNQLVKINDSSI